MTRLLRGISRSPEACGACDARETIKIADDFAAERELHPSRILATSIVGAVACCCSGPDQPVDGGLDASGPTDSGSDALSRDSGRDARGPDAVVVDAREGLPDAPFDDAVWEHIPGLAADCNVRVARDPAAALGGWHFEPCVDALEGCLAVRRGGFSSELPQQLHIVDVSAGRFAVTLSERVGDGGHTDYLQFTRSGTPEIFLRNIFSTDPLDNCNFADADVEASHAFSYFTDTRRSDSDLNRAKFPLLSFRDGVWSLHATLEYDVLRNWPQDSAFSDGLIANRVAPSNRMLTVLSDGRHFFTAPGPPFEGTRIHSTPSVVGEHWVATGLMRSTASGLFMSHLGEPSIRIRDVDAVGEVVADETDIVWLEGSRLTEGIRLDGTTLWRAPWRPGPIDPDEARIVRPIEDVARIFRDVRNPGNAFLRMVLGGGYVAMRDGLGEACYVIRLSDGHMARFDPPGYTCSSARHIGERELAVVVAREGDLSFRSAQLWFVPLAALTLEP